MVAVLLLPTAAAADERAYSAAEGYQLAQRLCQSCHLVDDKADIAVPAGIPTFRGIANRPGQTAERIRGVLMKPHAPMPDARLTGQEIESILSYLETLRTDRSAPPLVPPPGAPKPKYPQPS